MAGKLAFFFVLVLCFIALADARGTLRVDNIVAVEDPVVIDALVNEEAEIATSVAADTLGFGNFDTLRLNAPFIDVTASFVDVTSTGDFVSQSAEGSLSVGARQQANVNGDRINFTSREGDVRFASDFGGLSVIAGDQIVGSGATVSVTADAGGIAVLSEGHDATFDASNSLFLLSDEATGVINVETSDDLTATATTQAFLVAGGAVDMDSRAKTIFDASESLNMVSSFGDVIVSAGDEVHVTAGDEFSVSAISTSITSNSDGADINGFEGTNIDSSNGRLSLTGTTKGVSFTALDGQVGLTSTESSIDFSAVGAGDHAAVYVRGDVSATLTGDLSADAQFNTQVLGNDVDIDFGAGSLDADDDISIISHNDAIVGAGAGDLLVEADEIRLLAAAVAEGDSTFSVDAEDVNFAGNDFLVYGSEVDVRAGDENFSLESSTISINALGGDSRDHFIAIEAEDVNFEGGDVAIAGGRVHFTGVEQVDMEVGGDASFSTRQLGGEDSFAIQSGGDVSIESNDGDFRLTDAFGSLEWRFTDNAAEATEASVNIQAGNFDLAAGDGPFQTDVEFTLVAKQGLSFSATGGNTASDVNFDADDVIFTSAQNAAFQGDSSFELTSDNDIYYDADNIIINSDSSNGDVLEFDVGDFLYVVTERNPTTTDSITFSSTGTTTLDIGEFTADSSGSVTLSGDVSNTITSDDTITFSSGNDNPITFDVETFSADVSDDILFTGLFVTFDAATDVSVTAGDDYEFTSTKLGFDVDSTVGGVTFTSGGDLDVSSENNDITTSSVSPLGPSGPATFTAGDDIQVTASDSTTIISRSGDVNFASTDSSATFNGAADMSFSTGTADDAVFEITAAGTLTFDADRTISINGGGPFVIDAEGDYTITGADVDFLSNGPITFNGDTQTVVMSTGTFDFTGGAIAIEATATDVTFNGGEISIDNQESGIAHEEFLNVVDDLVFTAGNSIIVEAGDLSYDSSDFSFVTNAGRVLLSGDNVLLNTVSDNQDAWFQTETAITFVAEEDITQYAAGDYTIDATKFVTVNAASADVSSSSDFKLEAQAGELIVTNTGDLISFIAAENVNAAEPTRVSNNIEFRADDELRLIGRTGLISFDSAGSSQLRLNRDGGRNTQGSRQNFAPFAGNGGLGSGLDGGVPNLVNQAVGFSVNTRHAEGNVIFQTLEGGISFSADDTVEIITNAAAEVEVTDGGASFTSGSFELEALDGSFSGFAPLGVLTIDTEDDLDFVASGSMEILSDQLVTVTTGRAVDITAFGGDLTMQSFLQNDIAISARGVEFTSGAKGQNFVAQGDITATSAGDTTISGNRGVSLSTNAGPVSILSATTGNNFDADEEIIIHSGSDLLLENGGDANEDIRFNGVGVVLSASQGDVNLGATNDVLLDAATVVIQSLGTSSTSRDRVLFDSNGNLVTFTADNAFIDATELVSIGKTTTPVVSFTSASDIDINSSGNIDITSDDIISFTATDTFASQSENLLSLSAFNAFGITGETGVTLEAIRGSMNLRASSDITLDADDIRLTSEGLTSFTQSSDDPMDWVITNELSFVSQNTIDLQVGGDVLYTSGANIDITSDTRNGDHDLTFESEGDQTFTIVNAIAYSAEDTIDVTALGAATISSVDFSATTQRDGDIIVDTAGTFDLDAPDVTATAAAIDVTSTTGDIIATSTANLDITAGPAAPLADQTREGHISLASASDDVSIDATTTLFLTTDDLMTVDAEGVVLNAGTDLTLSTDYIRASTESFGEGNIDFIAENGITLSATGGPLEFNADVMDVTADTTNIVAGDDVVFTSSAFREGSVRVEHNAGGVDWDAPAGITFFAGDAEGPGDILVQVDGSYIAGGDFIVLGNLGSNDDVAPVYVSAEGPITLTAGDQLQVVAETNFYGDYAQNGYDFEAEDDFGAIDITAGGGDFLVDATTVNVFAVEAGISLTSVANDISFDAIRVNVTSQGIESGIFMHAREGAVNVNIADELLIDGDEHVSFNALNGEYVSDFSQQIFSVSGPGGEDGAGFKLSLTEPETTFDIAGATTIELIASQGDVRFLAGSDVDFDVEAAQITGNTVLLNAEGFDGPDEALFISQTASFTFVVPGDLEFMAGSSFTIEPPALGAVNNLQFSAADQASIIIRADEDVVFEHNSPATITATDELLVVSENNGIEIASNIFSDLTITAEDSFTVTSGIDEQENSINFVQPGIVDILTVNTVDLLIDASNNALFESTDAMTVTSAAQDITFRARKGSQLFRSVTLDGLSDPTNPSELTVEAGEDILMAAHFFIRHRGHERLSFFEADSEPNHNTESAPRQNTTPDLFNGGTTLANTCRCSSNFANCANVACPDTFNKIQDMQRALAELGLLRIV